MQKSVKNTQEGGGNYPTCATVDRNFARINPIFQLYLLEQKHFIQQSCRSIWDRRLSGNPLATVSRYMLLNCVCEQNQVLTFSVKAVYLRIR
jgi:hypothetical protein